MKYFLRHGLAQRLTPIPRPGISSIVTCREDWMDMYASADFRL